MNERELRELDIWIGCNLFGKVRGSSIPYYTTDATAAMMVLKHCAERESQVNGDGVQIDKIESGWLVSTCNVGADAETLPLAICRFAKELFKA